MSTGNVRLVDLSPPPKFGGNLGQAPTTDSEWAIFYRWLFSLYVVVADAANIVPPVVPVVPGNGGGDLSESLALTQRGISGTSGPFVTQLPPTIPAQLTALQSGDAFPIALAQPKPARVPIEILICTQATFPALAGTQATFVFVTDYVHLIYWNGAAFSFAGDQSGCVSLWESNPGTGYQLCDGSTVNRLNADGTVTSVTVPDFTTATFLEGGLANSGPTAASAPTFTGNAATPTGAVSAPIFSGTPVLLTTDTFTPVLLATKAITTIDLSDTSYTPAGTNSAPVFTGNSATPTGTVSATGEPRKLIRRPYYRR